MNRRNIPDSIRYKEINGVKHKICLECEEYFPMTREYFYKNSSNKKDGFNTYCIPCVFKRAQKWVNEHPEKYKEQKLRKVANKTDIQRQRSRDAANKNRKDGYQKQWRQEHPEKLKGYNKYRNMHKDHEISDEEWIACKEYFGNSCAYCGISEEQAKETQGHSLHMEHAINNGANDLSNCIPSCRSCNSQKWMRDFDEWYTEENEKFEINRYKKIIQWLDNDFKLFIEDKEIIQ